jgi:peptidylprolyl isomerase
MSKRFFASICAVAGLATSGCLDGTTGPQCQQVSTLVTGTSGDTVNTATGLRYIETQAGTGVAAFSCEVATVTYVGALTNGNVFDQSPTGGYAFIPGASQVIPGFEQGVVGMKVGGSRRLIIPASLGYGPNDQVDRSTNPPTVVIPGNSTIGFDVTLRAATQPAD